ncbi:hypothetical protein [Bradyrhizobium sp. SZCCHNRI1073]|uniref:hypothetical protein n=1 Tax=Bradyrhizobium sp. SZCCHNRI1073 TaxID=3057280 RepID=UPI00291697D6|nr:hypothetical protein [Bradyrhizobium sp. SZCCHNRI1073]
MPLLPFGEWKPDVADYEGQATKNVLNVLPRGDGYGPFPDFAILSQALPAACRGAFYALKSDGSVQIFAGTSDRLYTASNTDYSWTPVSKVATVTISNASPGVVTLASHGFAANDPVVFSTTGSLPTGLTAGTKYFVKTVLTANTFTVSATAGGAAINTSSAGSGTHSVTWIYSSLSSDAQWQFAQFGNLVFATQKNVVLQVYNLTSSSAFADNSGSPPQASYISVVGRFLVLSGLLSQPFRIHWSGLNDTTQWTSGVGSSDYQDFPDGGTVRGVAGGEFGTVFQDQAIRRMSYIPGSSLIFQIERIAQDVGLFAPYSIVRAGTTIFFHSAQGFFRIVPGGIPEQIGRERVDRTFFDDLDKTELRMFIGVSDPRATRAFWAYKSTSGTTALYDKIIGFDYALNRWFTVSMTGEYLLGMSQPGLTLESLDTLSSSIDALAATLDSFAVSTQPLIAQFSSAHKLGFFSGSNLQATLETAEQGTDGRRIFVNGFRPVVDASSVYGSASYRERTADTPTSLTEIAMNSRTGRCDMRRSTRYSRMKIRIPASQLWTFAAGVEPDIRQEGFT